MPSAYGDRRKLTKDIHRQYRRCFATAMRACSYCTRSPGRCWVRAPINQSLLDRIGALRRIPVLIVWGIKDTASPPYQLARWQSLLPHATVTRIEGAGHWPHEEEPARVIAALECFLK